MVAMEKLSLCMSGVLEDYEKLLVQGQDSGVTFWDLVILTTSDAAQQDVYQLEIEKKLERGEIPTCAKYHIIPDPPGAKIGSGGSTMYALAVLAKREPNWRSMKILLMHAGGSSQRLPSASVLGKAFTAIPIGDRLYTMFDLKLAMCLPFVTKLPCGVFICCPDTFETFTFGNVDNIDLTGQAGFVALAHPSPIHVGTGHGVYIMSNLNPDLDTEVLPCQKVLQKPTEWLMKDEAAVVDSKHVPQFIRDGNLTKDWVFTDSNFFFDHQIAAKLVEFYEQNCPLKDELCAYGDFLQPLGVKANDIYISNCKNIMYNSCNLLSTRRKVFNMLKGSPLRIIALKKSKFYHIGTLGEYLDSFCDRSDLQEELGLSQFCFSACLGPSPYKGNGAIMHSLITNECRFDPHSIVEFCQFSGSPVTVQPNCVVSNCKYTGDVSITIPAYTFIQTVPVVDDKGDVRYVTLAFSVKDDMKAKAATIAEASTISYFGRNLSSSCKVLQTDEEGLFSKTDPISLWHAKLFPLSKTAEESFILALDIIKRLLSPMKRCKDAGALYDSSEALYSSADALYGSADALYDSADVFAVPCSSINCSLYGSIDHVRSPACHGPFSDLYSFADVVRRKNAKLMIEERYNLGDLIRVSQRK